MQKEGVIHIGDVEKTEVLYFLMAESSLLQRERGKQSLCGVVFSEARLTMIEKFKDN